MFLAPALALALAPSLSLPPNTKLVISAPRSYKGRGLRLCLSLRYRAETRQRCAVGDAAPNHNGNANSKSNSSQGGGGGGGAASAISKSRREMLLEYVRNVQPEFLELFVKRAPPQVVEAMRQTVTNMIGTLPPQFFVITITTVAENLAQLMYSVMMTGYMFKNAQYRLELQRSLEQVAITDGQNIRELTSSAGEDALDAMNTFIQRLLGVSDPAQLKRTPTETTAPELGRLLYWLMVVGYGIRNIEVRFDMERVLGMPSKLHELPPGENL